MLQPISKDAFDWDDDKAYIIILSSLIYNSSKVVRILESTDYNLDSIVEILLAFSEVLDELDMKQLAVFYKNWWQKFQKLCDRTTNVETDEEENDVLKFFCNLSSMNDSIKKLLEQVDVSQVFYQVKANNLSYPPAFLLDLLKLNTSPLAGSLYGSLHEPKL
ncbi:hypothetical protein Anas_12868 [Armadillidium nasatum]|uniref:Uncharacterized protein n=1 Tax=Armadillidium nasatum TaxID=96803 RepID=A0A5N5T622_9CRUS|nr:hypothetical protein Anas_12868 [Armadillidium nasatum]